MEPRGCGGGGWGSGEHAGSFAAGEVARVDARNNKPRRGGACMQLEVWAGADENDVSPLPTRSTEISSKSTLLRRVEPKIAELGGGYVV